MDHPNPAFYEKQALSSAEALRAVSEAFFAALAERRPGLEPRIRELVRSLEAKVAHLVVDERDAGNAGFALLAVAAFEVLAEEGSPSLSQAEAFELVEACLIEPIRAWVLEKTAQMLDDSPDPFAALVATSKEREESFFGPSFVFERPVDDGYGYVLHIERCLFHEVLVACGHPELQPILCRFDLNWIDAIDPERHRMRFVRPSTFASAAKCRMWFMRTEHLGARELGARGTDRRHLPLVHG